VALPPPRPGLVVSYAYLWRDQAMAGLEEGRKDRPCVVILAARAEGGRTIVTVAPVTHRAPARPELGVEIPPTTKRRLGLDEARSWIIAHDLNRFEWPGVDLRPVSRGAARFDYGELPAALYRQLRDRVLMLAREGRTSTTSRGG
jgi:hypothetical protein